MPSLDRVLILLTKYPKKGILINQKDYMNRTVEAFLRIISNYDESVRRRVYFPRLVSGYDAKLNALSVPESIYQSGKVKDCFKNYALLGWSGYFPSSCRNLKFFVPIRESLERFSPKLKNYKVTDLLWGWPENFIAKAHKHGSEVYASQVDSVEELEEMSQYNLDGMMTNRIEIIGESFKKRNLTSP